MKSLKLFAQIAKIDELLHEVWGVATAEVIDKEGEIFDYASSKPYFEKWSDEIAKATDGKSLGNVREMHAPSAVGKLVAISFDDQVKQIDVTLQGLITNASLQVLQYIDRPHILSSVLGPLTENYDGNGSDRLLPRNFPIISVSSLSIDGVAVQAATTPTTAGYLWDGRRILLRGFRFCRGLQNVQLSYSAGYPSVPLDLKQAAIEAFALTYRQRVRIGEKSNSMSGQVNVSFDMGDVPPRSMAIFNQYRRLAL